MNLQDQPVQLLLDVRNGIQFKAKLSDTSSVKEIDASMNPITHLVIVAEDESLTWQQFREAGMEHGDLVSIAMKHKDELVGHFLPGLNPADAEARFEVNTDGAASRPTVHTHVVIGHKSHFGYNGSVRRCVDDIRKPALIEQSAFIRQAQTPGG